MKKIVFAALGILGLSIIIFSTISQKRAAQNLSLNKNDSLPPLKNPRLIIKKSARTLELFDGENSVKTYKISLGFAPEGKKETQGDGKTPEGDFYIFTKNNQSKFYLSLGVSYPSANDAERGLKRKTITRDEYEAIINAIKNGKKPLQNTKLGGEIYIHGGGTGKDWTRGCVALANEDIKELFDALPAGTPVKIEA